MRPLGVISAGEFKAVRTEASALLRLGAPMAMTQLIQFSINTVDVLMIGRLGPEPLAAAALGLVMFYIAFLIGFGPAMAVAPLVSQAIGARPDDHDDVRRSVRMALWVIAIGFPLVAGFYLFTTDLALWLGQPEAMARLAGPYVLALAPGLPFFLGVIVLRNFLATIGKTRAPLFIIVATTIVNALLNYLLIYGAFGFPRLELVGAGIASAISHAIGFVSLVAFIRMDAKARVFQLFRDFFVPDWARFREVLALGWPIGVTTAFEGMLFNAAVFLMGRIGVAEVAAYQIAINVSALAFMSPLGISMAGSVRVGLAAGAGDRVGVRRSAIATVLICIGAIMIIAIPVLAAPGFVAALFLDRSNSDNRQVLALAASFLRIAALFMIFDAVQVAANQALRGLKDVRAPMIITGIAYWLIGFPLAAGLGLASPLGAVGVWWGLLAGLGVAALLLGERLRRATR